jgi:murein DD-endopeptidase MepM/ murein hydrolase activator NlpD
MNLGVIRKICVRFLVLLGLGLGLGLGATAFGAETQEPRFRLQGELIEGGLIHGSTEADAVVRLDGKAIRVSEDGLFLLGFGRKAAASALLEFAFADGEQQRRQLKIADREYDTQRIDGLPGKMVTPSAEDYARIKADQALINKARARDTRETNFTSGFQWPAVGIISGVYGSQRILNGKPKQPHYGVDVAAPTGTPVYAPADGIVSLVHDDMYYTGGTIMIDHGHGLASAFLHLSKVHVVDGQKLKSGELIAEIGATGRATGPHLDWRMNLFGTHVDARFLVGPMPAPKPNE